MIRRHFGICEWSLPVSGTTAIGLAGEIGYDGIQLGEAGGRPMGYPLTNPRIQEIYKETAERYGVKLHSLNLGTLLAEGFLNYGQDTIEGAYARDSLTCGFEAGSALGVDAIVITVDAKTDEELENAAANLDFACRLAQGSAMHIAVEAAQPMEQIEKLLERIDPSVKLCMDILNPLRFQTGNPRQQILAFGRERIDHFHMKDSLSHLFQPGERGCVLLGKGDAGYLETVDVIKSLSYTGWIITENYYYLPPMNSGRDDFADLARKDLETMKNSF